MKRADDDYLISRKDAIAEICRIRWSLDEDDPESDKIMYGLRLAERAIKALPAKQEQEV